MDGTYLQDERFEVEVSSTAVKLDLNMNRADPSSHLGLYMGSGHTTSPKHTCKSCTRICLPKANRPNTKTNLMSI